MDAIDFVILNKEEKTRNRMIRKCFYWGLPLLGVVFCLWYVKNAACDIVYTDYIRLINSYLPDVWNPQKFFVPDVLTRIPANYLSRIINVTFFGYSTMFDMVMGVLGLGLAGLVFARYSEKKSVGWIWYGLLTIVMFSLNKWEMLTNGTGWVHFLAFACFYYNYLVFDRVWTGHEKTYDGLRLILLPFIITICIAGPYCAIYSVTLILACAFRLFLGRLERKKLELRYLIYLICTLVPLLLYLWSNSYAVENHAGAVNEPLLDALVRQPSFFLKFFLKSFAGMILGGETMLELISNDLVIYLLGVLVIAAYLGALWLNIWFRLYEKTVFPLLLIVGGGLNHVLILVSRWIFLQENYSLSSRYALQFQMGILGIILTIALLWREISFVSIRAAAVAVCMVFLAGNLITCSRELRVAPYREQTLENLSAIALDFEDRTEEDLAKEFQYSKGGIHNALEILKANHWNIFREQAR